MSLREQFAPDLVNVFHNTEEFATRREFRINDGHGGFKVFLAIVVWDEESAKRQPAVARHGMYLGDVICFMQSKDLPRKPVAGELIYSPANQPWEVLQIVEEEYEYKLSLSATSRSQPTTGVTSMVALTIDGSQIEKLVKAVKHIDDGVPKVVKPVIAETLEMGKQVVQRAIQAQYVIQSSDIHMSTRLVGMKGTVEIRGGMLRLTRFPHHPTASTGGRMPALMWAQVKRGGGGVMPGGFMTGSGDGIFIRSGGALRLPINKLLTIGAPIMASQPAVGPVANKEMGDALDRNISKALEGVLAGG